MTPEMFSCVPESAPMATSADLSVIAPDHVLVPAELRSAPVLRMPAPLRLSEAPGAMPPRRSMAAPEATVAVVAAGIAALCSRPSTPRLT
jgi:hypothetical protein